MSKPTVKLVADVEPALAQAFADKAKREGLTKRAALEVALRAYVEKGNAK